MAAEQLTFFASLDFPGRSTLKVGEVAERLGVTAQHILNLVEDGSFTGIDLKGKKASVRCVRIPVECYRNFIIERLTGPYRLQLLRELPLAVRRELYRELAESLRPVAA